MSAITRLTIFSSRLATEVQNVAVMKDLPAALLAALVLQESGGRASAWRFEPPYRYYWDCARNQPFREPTAVERAGEMAPADFRVPDGWLVTRHTEWVGQACSWGPLQVMGAVAREYGFRGDFTELCGAGPGLEYGAMHLHKLRNRFQDRDGWEGVAAAYNAGSPRRTRAGGPWVNQEYVDSVRKLGGFEGIA